MPIFFVMVGLSLNLRAIDWGSPFIWAFSLSLFVIALSTLLSPMLLKTYYGRFLPGEA